MEELYEIVKGLHKLLKAKQKEIEELGRPMDSYLMSEIENRENEIDAFARRIGEINVSRIEIKGVVETFKKSAEEIRERIIIVGEKK